MIQKLQEKYQDLFDALQEELEKRGMKAEFSEYHKNGILMSSIKVTHPDVPTIVPQIPLSGLPTLQEDPNIVATLVSQLEEGFQKRLSDFSLLRSYEASKDSLLLRPAPVDRVEGLSQSGVCFHRSDEVKDVVFIPYVRLKEGETCNVTHSILRDWGVTLDEAVKTAKENTIKDYTVEELASVLKSFGVPDTPACPMYIITNENRTLGGAGAFIPEVAEKIKEEIFHGENFYILPSSIHESLCIPVLPFALESVHESELLDMVKTINATEVAPEDRLIDNVYFYDGHFRSVEELELEEEEDFER